MALYLNEHDVQQLASMSEIVSWVEAAHLAHARGEAVDFPRQRTKLPGSVTHMLQGGLPGLGVTGCKLYTSSREGNRFWVHLFASKTGTPLAVLEANWLGMMRTGAAAAVAAKWLSRPDSSRVALFGAGWQAQGQLLGLAAVRSLSEVQVIARNPDKLAAFCERMSAQTGVKVIPAVSAEDAVRSADIVVTATTASKPLLSADWLQPGVHINAVGSNALIRQELDEDSIKKAGVVCVDARTVALREAGDLWPLFEKGRLSEGRMVEIGEIIAGFREGRRSAEQITLFESQGMAIQDLAVAAHMVERATAQGMGTALPY